jgi:rhodanese-related sulfurtransferase
VGVYRLWRDLGYAIGALLAGVVADAFGLSVATLTVAALTFASGVIVAVRMRETLGRRAVESCIEAESLAQAPSAIVIDVRSPDEYARGHVDGALNIPLDVMVERVSGLPKDALVVTACGKGGGRSEQAAALLRDLGFARVRSLCGGTQAWRAYGHASRRGAA